jgi:hypothetical protein
MRQDSRVLNFWLAKMSWRPFKPRVSLGVFLEIEFMVRIGLCHSYNCLVAYKPFGQISVRLEA